MTLLGSVTSRIAGVPLQFFGCQVSVELSLLAVEASKEQRIRLPADYDTARQSIRLEHGLSEQLAVPNYLFEMLQRFVRWISLLSRLCRLLLFRSFPLARATGTQPFQNLFLYRKSLSTPPAVFIFSTVSTY